MTGLEQGSSSLFAASASGLDYTSPKQYLLSKLDGSRGLQKNVADLSTLEKKNQKVPQAINENTIHAH